MTTKRVIPSSELIINPDGSIFHLHLKPGEIADTVILVGDQDRVAKIAARFDSIELTRSSREFCTSTGMYKGKRMSVVSTGIGTDNIDIVVNELDALVNIDLTTRTPKDRLTKLRLVRLGTSGALQDDIPLGGLVRSTLSVGFDGVLHFYAGSRKVCLAEFEKAFMEHTQWNPLLSLPYVVPASQSLNHLFADATIQGMTMVANGFYGPQGRQLRLELMDPLLNEKFRTFMYQGFRITNYEMEGSALAGLSALMGHEAITICTIIANRAQKEANVDYGSAVEKMIVMALDKLCQ